MKIHIGHMKWTKEYVELSKVNDYRPYKLDVSDFVPTGIVGDNFESIIHSSRKLFDHCNLFFYGGYRVD